LTRSFYGYTSPEQNERYVREWLVSQAAGGYVDYDAGSRQYSSNSLAQNGPALGAVASEAALREVVLAGGFKKFRRATETPFNRIFEARK
jgi:hypothetical protein